MAHDLFDDPRITAMGLFSEAVQGPFMSHVEPCICRD